MLLELLVECHLPARVYEAPCVQGQWNSMEKVMKQYKTAAMERVLEAKAEADKVGEADVKDEDTEEAPELLLMHAVNSEDSQVASPFPA